MATHPKSWRDVLGRRMLLHAEFKGYGTKAIRRSLDAEQYMISQFMRLQ